jgi:hypothetical protein
MTLPTEQAAQLAVINGATNYYVNSATGNDANAGTLAAPWGSVR